MAKPRKRKGKYPGITVYRRGNGAWYAKYLDPHTHKDVRVSLRKNYGVTKLEEIDEALAKLNGMLIDERRHAAIRGRRVNLKETWDEIEARYLNHLEADKGEDAAVRTSRDWLRLWRIFRERAKVSHGDDLTKALLGEFRNYVGTAEVSLKPATRNRHLNAVRAMLHVARKSDCIRLFSDDINEQLKPFGVEAGPPVVLTTRDLQRLLKWLPEHDLRRHYASRENKSAYVTRASHHSGSPVYKPWGPFVLLALLTGARPSEVLRIRTTDIDPGRMVLHVRDSKRKQVREVPLHDSPALQQLLRALFDRTHPGGYLCTGELSEVPPVLDRRAWKRFSEQVHLPGLRPKDFRSTTVAHVASASNEPEYLLEARFGHGARVSKRHYRQPLHGTSERGCTVEEWLGVSDELRETMATLGLMPLRQAEPGRIRKRAAAD